MNRNFLLLLAAATVPVSAQVNITAAADRIAVEIDGKPYTTLFLPVAGNKPYLYPLSTASALKSRGTIRWRRLQAKPTIILIIAVCSSLMETSAATTSGRRKNRKRPPTPLSMRLQKIVEIKAVPNPAKSRHFLTALRRTESR